MQHRPGGSKRGAISLFHDTRPASYPSNGRTLTDDALDHFLSILTNGKVTTDGVGAHSDLLSEFPDAVSATQISEPNLR